MKTVANIVSAETAMTLRQARILESTEPSPTITECIVWFAEQGIAIITDYNDIDKEWDALACGRVPGTRERRCSQSYTEAMNAAIRDAADEYTKQKSAQ